MAQLPTFIEISVRIPLTTTIETYPARVSLTADITKANRFCRKVDKLCTKYGYGINIERTQMVPPTHGSNVQKETRNQTNAEV